MERLARESQFLTLKLQTKSDRKNLNIALLLGGDKKVSIGPETVFIEFLEGNRECINVAFGNNGCFRAGSVFKNGNQRIGKRCFQRLGSTAKKASKTSFSGGPVDPTQQVPQKRNYIIRTVPCQDWGGFISEWPFL